MSFTGFQSFKFSLKNHKPLAYGFSENRQILEKTDRNSIILGRKPYILDRLYIMTLHMSFYGF
jgi:hypothetical protein